MTRYTDKHVLVTGGSAGIGLETARMLVDEGANVMITGRGRQALEDARASLGGRVSAVRSDAASSDDVEALAREVRSELGHLDLLFINAGITRATPFAGVAEAEFDEVFAINAKGPYFTVQRLAPMIAPGGSVVVTTSVAAVSGFPLVSAYAASKAALRSMVRSLARELSASGVRVNAVSPGVIDTSILERTAGKQASDAAKRQVAERNPMQRIGRPEEVAKAVLFLAFEATYTTGAEIPVDGGATQL